MTAAQTRPELMLLAGVQTSHVAATSAVLARVMRFYAGLAGRQDIGVGLVGGVPHCGGTLGKTNWLDFVVSVTCDHDAPQLGGQPFGAFGQPLIAAVADFLQRRNIVFVGSHGSNGLVGYGWITLEKYSREQCAEQFLLVEWVRGSENGNVL